MQIIYLLIDVLNEEHTSLRTIKSYKKRYLKNSNLLYSMIPRIYFYDHYEIQISTLKMYNRFLNLIRKHKKLINVYLLYNVAYEIINVCVDIIILIIMILVLLDWV